mgnify:CR=1 FL=1
MLIASRKPIFLCPLLLAIGALLLGTNTGTAEDTSKPNLLFILVDDFGARDLGCYGSDLYQTPNMDRLAKEGMKFTQAYAAHPRCVPSRYAIFSGRIPGRDGVPGFEDRKVSKHTLKLPTITWGEVLKDAGYSTGYIGKWHLGKAGGEPDKQGFDDSRIANQAGAPPSYFYPFDEARKPGGKEHFPKVEGTPDEYLTDRLTEESLDFIEQNKDKPFALVLAHYAVHTPLEAPEQTVDQYSKRIKEMGREVAEGRKDKDIKTVGNGSFKTVQNNPTYAAMVDHVDQGIGKILNKLETLGILENTIIVLTSDHGGLSTRSKDNGRPLATSNSPFRNGKGWLYEGGVRVPLIVRWPGRVKPGTESTYPVLGTDHYPTFLNMLGAAVPAEAKIDGINYLPALKGESTERETLFFHSPLGRPTQTGDHPASAIIDGDWKLIELHQSGKFELYNLKSDPSEQKNLAETEDDQLQKMIEKLKQLKQDLGTKQKS